MKKSAWIFFHKNISRYPVKWTIDYLNSIRYQNYTEFDVLEIDYGGQQNQMFEGSIFYSEEMDTHAHAHNFLCLEAVKMGYDYIFNSNCDDLYTENRVAAQLPYMLKGYDVVSANHTHITADTYIKVDEDPKSRNCGKEEKDFQFSGMNIRKHANDGHNVISHPCVCYSKNFIEKSGLLVPEEIPKDDFCLWKRSYGKFRFFIIPKTLLYHRIWDGSISAKKAV